MSVSPPAPIQEPIPPTSSQVSYTAIWTLMGCLRDVREELQNIERSANDVLKNVTLIDANARHQEVHTALTDASRIFEGNRARVTALLSDLRYLMRSNPDIYDRFGDEVTEIENEWERIYYNWPAGDAAVEEISARFLLVQESIDSAVFHCGLVTIPERANQHLEQLRSGQVLDFAATFNDEMRKPADLQKLLEYLSAHPLAVNGVVDVPSGLIFRASPNFWRRFASYAFIAFLVVAGLIVLWFYKWIAAQEPPQLKAFLAGSLPKAYLFILIGSIAHILINAVKQARAQTAASLRAIDDWLMWIHVKELSIAMSIVSLWIGVIGLASLGGDVTPSNAFFVGYSIDSFVDLFLERFATTASTKAKAIAATVKA